MADHRSFKNNRAETEFNKGDYIKLVVKSPQHTPFIRPLGKILLIFPNLAKDVPAQRASHALKNPPYEARWQPGISLTSTHRRC